MSGFDPQLHRGETSCYPQEKVILETVKPIGNTPPSVRSFPVACGMLWVPAERNRWAQQASSTGCGSRVDSRCQSRELWPKEGVLTEAVPAVRTGSR